MWWLLQPILVLWLAKERDHTNSSQLQILTVQSSDKRHSE